jgi:hypothetical protein
MTLRTAAQQALEALEMWVEGPFDSSTRKGAQTRTSVAINALRTALAGPEQEPVQVTPLDFVTAVLGKEDCVGKPIMWAEWPNRAHGIGEKT